MENYLKNVMINEDKKYAQSYGSPQNTNYPFAKLNGYWIELYAADGSYIGKKNTKAKHFHTFEFEKEISERTFKKMCKKVAKIKVAETLVAQENYKKIQLAEIEKYEEIIEKIKTNLQLLENTKSTYSKWSCKWINEVAFRSAKKLDCKITELKKALKIYTANKHTNGINI